MEGGEPVFRRAMIIQEAWQKLDYINRKPLESAFTKIGPKNDLSVNTFEKKMCHHHIQHA